MSDESGAALLAAQFPAKSYDEHLADLKAGRAAREAVKARLRADNPDWPEWRVIEEMKLPRGHWYDGDEYWEYRMGWSGSGKGGI